MTIRLQGIWEPERVARVIEMWNPANEDLEPWRDDCVARIRRQIDASASKRLAAQSAPAAHSASKRLAAAAAPAAIPE